MKNKLVVIVLIILLVSIGYVLFKMYSSNKKIENYQFSDEELEIVETFKEIKLQPTIGNPYTIVKWKSSISIYVENFDSTDYVPKYVLLAIENLNKIIPKNQIIIKLTDNQLESNVVLYIGERDDVEKKVPTLLYDVEDDIFGYTELEIYDRNNTIYRSRIFIESGATYEEQFSTFLEEMMHCIGFIGHTESPKSILFEERDEMNITEYNDFDASLIRLLYHPEMYTGLNASGVEKAAKKIFMNEKLQNEK